MVTNTPVSKQKKISCLVCRIFFSASDAIFLNYGWDKEKLKNSSERCQKLHRPFDVYVGVDVWGRGCFGGGGFDTNLVCHFLWFTF